MAWTAPMTAVSNTVFTAAQWNTYVRDNMLQSLPALASATAGNHYVSTAANAMAERTITSATAVGVSTTTATSYGNLADAVTTSVTATTGTAALVFFSAKMANSLADTTCQVSVAVSSATTIASSDSWMLSQDGLPATRSGRGGMVHLFSPNNGIASNGLTAGSNVFTLQYKVSAGTGTFQRRDIAVIAL